MTYTYVDITRRNMCDHSLAKGVLTDNPSSDFSNRHVLKENCLALYSLNHNEK